MIKKPLLLALAGVMAAGAVAHAQDAFWYRHPIPGISTAVEAGSGNRSPVITGVTPGLTAQVGDVIAPFSAITIEDADGDILTTTIAINNIALGSLTSGSFVSEGAGIYRLSALPDATTAAIRAMSFMVAEDAAPAGSTAALEFSISSQDEDGASSSQTVSYVIEGPENQDPVIANVPSGLSVDAEDTIAPFSGITLSDPEDDILSVTITLDVPEAGSFTVLEGFTDDGDGVYSFSGLPDDATTALRALIFTPTEGRLEAGEEEDVEFTLLVEDVADASATVVVDLTISRQVAGAGTLWAFGNNHMFQMGIPELFDEKVFVPTQVGEADTWISVAAGGLHALGIQSDGSLWSWGDYWDGALGQHSGSESPTRVGSATDWAAIFAGEGRSFAMKTDGTLWGWGRNDEGQIGVGDTIQRWEPTRVNGDTDWVTVAVGDLLTVALKTDGSLWAWGQSHSATPTRIGFDNDWTAIAAGYSHALALKANGSLFGWGGNNYAQLGLGHTDDVSTPTQIGVDNGWTTIRAIGSRNVALKSDGSMWTWGNWHGYTGSPPLPTQIAPGHQWTDIVIGYDHNFAKRSDGSLWGWGYASGGQLGVSAGTRVDTPILLSHGPWRLISANWEYTMAIK